MEFPYNIISIHHIISPASPSWNNNCGYQSTITLDYPDNPVSQFKVMSISMECGLGTHLDSPSHCNPQGKMIHQLTPQELFLQLYIIDISDPMGADNYLTIEDIINFELQNGPIAPNSVVIIKTGWSIYWDNKSIYHNNYQFPYVTYPAAQYLFNKDIKALGIDTLSPERPSSDFPIHQLFLNNNKLIIENINTNDLQPTNGCYLLISPLPMATTESPVGLWVFQSK
jgi:kynurenine formamidase